IRTIPQPPSRPLPRLSHVCYTETSNEKGRVPEMGTAGKVMGAFISIIGVAICAFSLLSTISEIIFLSTAIATQGRVISFVRIETKNPDHPAYHPLIEFTAKSGETIRFQSQFSLDGRPQSIGNIVPVLYDPYHPEHAQVDPGVDLWGQY